MNSVFLIPTDKKGDVFMKQFTPVLIFLLFFPVFCFSQSQRGNASYNPSITGFTIAHPSLSFNTKVRIINLENNRYVDATVRGRIPITPNRIVDISQSAGDAINMSRNGMTLVELVVLTSPGQTEPTAAGEPPAGSGQGRSANVPAEGPAIPVQTAAAVQTPPVPQPSDTVIALGDAGGGGGQQAGTASSAGSGGGQGQPGAALSAGSGSTGTASSAGSGGGQGQPGAALSADGAGGAWQGQPAVLLPAIAGSQEGTAGGGAGTEQTEPGQIISGGEYINVSGACPDQQRYNSLLLPFIILLILAAVLLVIILILIVRGRKERKLS
jgi:hypothetical protein